MAKNGTFFFSKSGYCFLIAMLVIAKRKLGWPWSIGDPACRSPSQGRLFVGLIPEGSIFIGLFKTKEVLYLGSGNRKDSPIKHQDLKILRKIEEFSLEDRLTRYNSMQFKKYFED